MEQLADAGIEAIVVGIPNIGDRRFHEYMPFPAPNSLDVQGDEYVAFIADTLKPIIDRNSRTLSDAASTGIIGSSLGGLISLYAMFRRPQPFGLRACSARRCVGAEAGIFPFMRQRTLRTGKIYLDVGTAEGVGLVAGGSSQHSLASHTWLRCAK